MDYPLIFFEQMKSSTFISTRKNKEKNHSRKKEIRREGLINRGSHTGLTRKMDEGEKKRGEAGLRPVRNNNLSVTKKGGGGGR